MTVGNMIDKLKQINCEESFFEEQVRNAVLTSGRDKAVVSQNGREYFYDKRFDIDYQVTFNEETEPAIKLKVEKNRQSHTIKVVDAWV